MINGDEVLLMTLYGDSGTTAHEQFFTMMRTAYQLGHATRVNKPYESGTFPGPAICLYASKRTTPEWICDCGQTNNGLALDCRSCEQGRRSNPPDWAMTEETAGATS